jgi:hypothetical protein
MRLRRLWQPSAEKLDGIAATLRAHWRAATAAPAGLFFGTPVSWVTVQMVRANAHGSPAHHHFTTGGRLIK